MGSVVRIIDFDRPARVKKSKDQLCEITILPVGYVKIERDDWPETVTSEMFKNADAAFAFADKSKK